jgi:dihydropteroate synthase
MAAYRIMSKGSWSEKMKKATAEKRIEHNKRIEKMLIEVDEYSDYKYTKVIKKHIQENRFILMLELGKFNEIKTGEFKEYYSSLSLKNKMKIFIKQYFPNMVRFKRTIMRT